MMNAPPVDSPPPSRSSGGLLAAVGLTLVVIVGCSASDTGGADARDAGAVRCAEPGQWGDCELVDYDDRGYDVYVPTQAASGPVPVMVALHGGGGRSLHAITTSCPDGDRSSRSCLHHVAEDEGFAVVYPNGSGFWPLRRLRTWNAGGGGDWDCTSGRACEENVDDVAYIERVLDDVESWLDVDTARTTIVGHSNGGAMSRRLACELSDRVAAIAAVGGTNQFAATAPCEPEVPVAIMQVHGTDDSCWTYATSDRSCAGPPSAGERWAWTTAPRPGSTAWPARTSRSPPRCPTRSTTG
jgi:polyhydroxybutyrate depolymerase